MMVLKNRLLILPLTFFVLFFISCDTKHISSNERKLDEISGKITVSVYKSYEDYIKYAAESYRKLHPNVTIVIEVLDEAKIENALKDKNTNSFPDILMAQSKKITYYYNLNNEAFKELNSNFSYKDGFNKNRLEQVNINNKTYAVPIDYRPIMLFYRKDLLESRGIKVEDIRTWSQFYSIGKNIYSESNKEVKLLALDQSKNIYKIFLNQLNKGYIDKENKFNLGDIAASRAFDTLNQLYTDNVLDLANNEQEVLNKLKAGKSIFTLASTDFIKALETLPKEGNYKFGVVKLPAFEAGGNRDVQEEPVNFLINNKLQSTKIAEDFIKYATTEKELLMEAMNKYYILPAYNSIYSENIFDNEISVLGGEKAWRDFEGVMKASFNDKYNPEYEHIDTLIWVTVKENLGKNIEGKKLWLDIMIKYNKMQME